MRKPREEHPQSDQTSFTGVVLERRDPNRNFPSSPLPQPNKPPSREFVLPARERKDHADGEIGRSGASSRCPFPFPFPFPFAASPW